MKVLLLSLAVALQITVALSASCSVPDPQKKDCGYIGITQQQCIQKGCCWQEVMFNLKQELKMQSPPSKANGVPWCFYPNDDTCNNIKLQSESPGFDTTGYNGMYNNFIKNLDILQKGGVAASPDNNTQIGSYYFDWMRDGSLSMLTFMELNDFDYSKIVDKMKDYVSWVLRVQQLVDPYSIDIRSEPKYTLPDGNVWIGGWCRPQSDGPALRSRTLMQFAKVMQDHDPSYVTQYLWTGSPSKYNGGAIKYDLDFLLSTYNMKTCDLWEDMESYDLFWNRMAYVDALYLGYQMALQMGDVASATKYHNTAIQVNNTLSGHWTGSIITEDMQNRQVDGAVVHAFLSFTAIPITSYYVSNTIDSYIKTFCQLYPINQADIRNNIPGILIGRYVIDSYYGGNPWQLLTAALAHIFYKLSKSMLDRPNQILLESEIGHWRKLLNLSDRPTSQEFALASLSAGDSILYRLHYHVQDAQYVVTEQMDKNTGMQVSAKGLTWSYANILNALHYRNKYLTQLTQETLHIN